MSTAIVIPTYNERENITPLIGAISAIFPEAHLVIVDDSSPDGTGNEVQKLQERFPTLTLMSRTKKEGLGKAYTHAFKELLARNTFDSIIMMDADFSHPPSALPHMLHALRDADLVIGSRYVPGGKTVGWELWRRLLSSGGNLYARLVIGIPVADLTAGFNAMRTSILKKLDLDAIGSSGYAFQIELKAALIRAGAHVHEMPITFTNRINGESKIAGHIISEGLIAPWKIRFSEKLSEVRA